jgi:hypothetical protein
MKAYRVMYYEATLESHLARDCRSASKKDFIDATVPMDNKI